MSKEQDNEITVNDRRMFNADGTLRQPIQEEAVKEPPAPAASESPRTESKTEPAESKKRKPSKSASSEFSNLVGMLTTNAVIHMGADPQYGRGNIDLETARHFIDMIAVLQEKTEGNLTDDESRLLNDMLTRLRMEYVTIANQLSTSAKNAKK